MIKTLQSELSTRDEWVQKHLVAGDALPFRFNYGKRPAKELLPAWKRGFSQSADSGGITRYTATWSDPATGLEVTCKAASYPDYPAIEWTLYFKNNGTEDTPILEDIQGIDISMPRNAEDDCIIKTTMGDSCSPLTYAPVAYDMAELRMVKFAPTTGKPCNGAFPYFNIQMGGAGVILAIGWPGQWAANFSTPYWTPGSGPSSLYISAGQELTCLSLKPGEEIRSPLSLLMFYEGGYTRSQNLWRRFFNAHNIPRPGGKPAAPMLIGAYSLYHIEEEQLHYIREFVENGIQIDYWDVDAGWFPSPGKEWWDGSGTWEPDRERLPNGIKPIADAAHANGMKLGLWFETERVHKDTWLHKNHPEWLYKTEHTDPFLRGSYLLNLGCPEALDWVIDLVDRYIAENGIDIYRQDFCYPPLQSWRGEDAPGRQGMSENLHVQGYLKLYDELMRRHPNLMIDSCAGGGGRQDIETNRRSTMMMTRTDYYPALCPKDKNGIGANQNITYGLAQWFSHFAGGGIGTDLYSTLSSFSFHMGTGPVQTPEDWEMLRDEQRMYREAAWNYYGDFYPLTECSREVDVWMAYQFDRPEEGEGIVQAFRRDESPEPAMSFKLEGLEADAEYEVSDVQAQRTLAVMRGAALMDAGLRVELPSPRSAALIKYKKWR